MQQPAGRRRVRISGNREKSRTSNFCVMYSQPPIRKQRPAGRRRARISGNGKESRTLEFCFVLVIADQDAAACRKKTKGEDCNFWRSCQELEERAGRLVECCAGFMF